MLVNWVTNIREKCHSSNVAFFFKQWGGVQKKRHGRILDGKTLDEMPSAIAAKGYIFQSLFSLSSVLDCLAE